MDLETRRQANKYLALLRQLACRTRDLLLLTATPMQLNEVELWALLELLAPDGWNAAEYRRFYQDLPDAPDAAPPDPAEWKYRRALWRKTDPPDAGNVLSDCDNDDFIAIRLNDPAVRQASLDTMQQGAPSRRLMSRHTWFGSAIVDGPLPRRCAVSSPPYSANAWAPQPTPTPKPCVTPPTASSRMMTT